MKASLALRDFEARLFGPLVPIVVLVVFLLAFNFILAGPFYLLIQWLFKLLIG